MDIASEFLVDLLVDSTFIAAIQKDKDSDKKTSVITHYCKNNETDVCYILDENGYIVATSDGDKYTGVFFGEVQGPLMEYLANETADEEGLSVGIFKRVDLQDTQSECEVSAEYHSDATMLITPFKMVASFVSMWFRAVLVVGANVKLYAMFLLQSHRADGKTEMRVNVSCTKTRPFYLLQRHKVPTLDPSKKKFTCPKNCKRTFDLALVPKTNLLFVHISKEDKCADCEIPEVRTDPVEIPPLNNCNQEPQYRWGPSTCYKECGRNECNGEEETTYCGSGNNVKPTLLMFVVMICINVLMFR